MLWVVALMTPEGMLAEAIGSAMARRRLSQTDVAERMTWLGYKWSRQTVSDIQNQKRTLRAGELYPLAFALEMPLPALVMPWTEAGPAEVEFPAGLRLRYVVETRASQPYARFWDGNTPKVAAGYTVSEDYRLGEFTSEGES